MPNRNQAADGPTLNEYYGGSEANGITVLDSHDWLAHPGSVGRPLYGTLYICDEDGNEQPVFHYHNDPEKTREAQHPRNPNWSAIGDIGYLDADGFLYLTDRKTFMIISGGVNILSSGN